jgi:hypothetical protein
MRRFPIAVLDAAEIDGRVLRLIESGRHRYVVVEIAPDGGRVEWFRGRFRPGAQAAFDALSAAYAADAALVWRSATGELTWQPLDPAAPLVLVDPADSTYRIVGRGADGWCAVRHRLPGRVVSFVSAGLADTIQRALDSAPATEWAQHDVLGTFLPTPALARRHRQAS